MLAVSLSLFSVVVCSFYRLCFYQLSSYLNSFLHSFYINFYTHFFIICNYFYAKDGYRTTNTRLDDRFLLLFYLIPFCRVALLLSLQNFNAIVNATGWECFNISFIGNTFLIIYIYVCIYMYIFNHIFKWHLLWFGKW